MSLPVQNIVKAVASTASTAAVGKVLSEIIKANTNPVTKFDRFQVAFGGAVLGMTIGKLAHDHVSAMVGEVAETVSAVVSSRKAKKSD